MPWATGRRLRSLHDPEAAALAAVTLLLGRLDPVELTAAEARVDRGARRVTTGDGRQVHVVSDLPSSAAELVPDEQLTEASVEGAQMLRATFQEMGFDYYFLPDTSTYFELLP